MTSPVTYRDRAGRGRIGTLGTPLGALQSAG